MKDVQQIADPKTVLTPVLITSTRMATVVWTIVLTVMMKMDLILVPPLLFVTPLAPIPVNLQTTHPFVQHALQHFLCICHIKPWLHQEVAHYQRETTPNSWSTSNSLPLWEPQSYKVSLTTVQQQSQLLAQSSTLFCTDKTSFNSCPWPVIKSCLTFILWLNMKD